MHLRGVKFDDLHSWDDLSLILMSQKVGLPPIKTCTVDLPAGDGELDLTDYFGGPQYGNRTLEFTFACVDDIWPISQKAQNLLHGRKCDITLDDDPGYYYRGRVSINDWDVNRVNGTLKMTCTCEPYKYKQDVTVVSGVIGADTGRNLWLNSNTFNASTLYVWTDYGVKATFTPGISVPEWGATDATRIQTTGGSIEDGSNMKLYKSFLSSEMPPKGAQFVLSLWIKNQAEKRMQIQPNAQIISDDSGWVEPGESKRLVLAVECTGVAYFQCQFHTESAEDELDIVVWRGKAEEGTTATPWSPAPEDGIDQTLTLTCPCDRMRVIPTITTDGAVNIVYGSTSVDVDAGTYRFTNIIFAEGDNILTITGPEGTTVSATYQEGAI